jgi:hypothetical protein
MRPGSALLPLSAPAATGRRAPSQHARVLLLVAAAGCALGLVLVGRAARTELAGVAPRHATGDIMNTLNHKLALHANVGGFTISGNLGEDDTQSLKGKKKKGKKKKGKKKSKAAPPPPPEEVAEAAAEAAVEAAAPPPPPPAPEPEPVVEPAAEAPAKAEEKAADCPGSPCVSVTKDLGNYVLSGTLHVTLSPEEAKNIQWQERAVDEAIEKTTALMPEVTEQASRLVQEREDIGLEEDKLGKLQRQNQDLKRMVLRIKQAKGPPGIWPYALSCRLACASPLPLARFTALMGAPSSHD